MGIRQDVLDQPVASIALGVSQPIERTGPFREFDLVEQITLLLMTKRFPITDQELKVPGIRLIDRRIIDLVDDSMAQRESHPATGMIGRSKPLFGTAGPPGGYAGRSKCFCQ